MTEVLASGVRWIVGVLVAAALLATAPAPAVAAPGAIAVDCNDATDPVDAVCRYSPGAGFGTEVDVTAAPTGGYTLLQTMVSWTDTRLEYLPAAKPADEIVWPDCFKAIALRGIEQARVNHGCLTGTTPSMPKSNHVGPVVALAFRCATDGTAPLDLVPYSASNTAGTLFVAGDGSAQVVPSLANAAVICGEDPPPRPPPPDIARVRIASKRVRVSRRGVAPVRVGCDGKRDDRCLGTLTLRARVRGSRRRETTVGRRSFRVTGGDTARVKVRLSKAARRLVRAKRRLRARGTAIALDKAGHQTTSRRTLVLKSL